MKEIRDILAAFGRRPGQPFALATLVRARGSSYRSPGARMLISHDGGTVGVLSGGCLEEEVASEAQQVIATGVPRLLTFDTRLRYGCNGAIDILIEKLQPCLLEQVGQTLAARRECLIATKFNDSHSLGSYISQPAAASTPNTFLQRIHPPLRVILIGNGPDSRALITFAETLGWEVMKADDANGLPNEFDQWTAAIVKTHNYGRDYAALAKLLPVGLRYVALLGPRRRRDQLLHALHDDGIAIRSELFAPAGFDLKAESPEEIALAIVTEIQVTFAGASAESLRDRKSSIHLLHDLAVA